MSERKGPTEQSIGYDKEIQMIDNSYIECKKKCRDAKKIQKINFNKKQQKSTNSILVDPPHEQLSELLPGHQYMILVNVTTLSNDTFTFNMESSDTIGTVKEIIKKKHGISIDEQVLILEGTQLNNDTVIQEISKDMPINLTLVVVRCKTRKGKGETRKGKGENTKKKRRNTKRKRRNAKKKRQTANN